MDQTFHFDADPVSGPVFHINPDPDPDPDPAPPQIDGKLRPLVYRPAKPPV